MKSAVVDGTLIRRARKNCRANLYCNLSSADGRFLRFVLYDCGMDSELPKQLLDAGFPAAKPCRDNELLGIPTLEELIAAVEQIHPGFRLSVKRINPDEWEAHSGFISIDGEVAYWA